jgi:type II restriction/modification system DNA methylase subunit YeeA
MTPSEFAAKWGSSQLRERAASQEHFIDLCRMLGEPTPAEADPTGEWYAFEKGAEKTGGGDGYADVWKRQHFAWEYKGKRKNLTAAYDQLLLYREALENPPLLVVCDMERFEVHTNYTGTRKVVHAFTLDSLRDSPAEPLRVLRAVMSDPISLKPGQTPEQVTEEAAGRFAELAGRLQSHGYDSLIAAHFLNRLLFCLFSEDIGLLPKGLFARLIEATRRTPEVFERQLRELFRLMARNGGYFGTDPIEWFDGGLFEDDTTLPLRSDELDILAQAARLDWSCVEPSILGTLFERGLDPRKRGQLGTHYTDRTSILRVVTPVILEPLRREFEAVKEHVAKLDEQEKRTRGRAKAMPQRKSVAALKAFLARLRNITVLDPACGSGNFLYVALQELKNLEKEVSLWGSEALGIPLEYPGVGPQVVKGIEINPYAAELAKTTIWIGEIQWMVNNGFSYRTQPVLQPLDTVECRDAVLDAHDARHPREAVWPEAEFIVGNPPFIGGKLMRASLGDEYVDALFAAWDGKVPREADFVCYWHEAARHMIERKHSCRVGLLATQGIRGGANQKVLKRIKETGDIFEAWQDEPWVVEGAAVHISIVCQDDGSETRRRLDGKPVTKINADLTGGGASAVDLTTAMRLEENCGISFMGDTKGGSFDIAGDVAREMLVAGPNPNGKPNSDVVVPWVNGLDVTRRPRDMFIVDFGVDMTERDAAMYVAPFEHVARVVRPKRVGNKRVTYAERWWIHVEARPAMRSTLAFLSRFLATPTVARHRSFSWIRRPTLPDHQLIVFAREDDYFFGVLQSRVHEVWALSKSSKLRIDFRYTPSSTFETFPFPWPLNLPGERLSAEQSRHHAAISAAAKALDDTRSRWLSPPELIREEPDVAPTLPARRIPVDVSAERALGERTITRLYNERPGWLDLLHHDLDRAVLEAYGWPDDLPGDQLLARLLALNHERASAHPRQGEGVS